MDGVLFMREYLKNEKIREHPRFKEQYLRELIELLNDEEAYIRIEALEIITELLDYVALGYIEKDYITVVLDTMTVGFVEIA
jgi:hypothetical protein